MFQELFSSPRASDEYRAAPLLDARLAYLRFCATQGATTAILNRIAFYQRALCRVLDLDGPDTFAPDASRAAAGRWVARRPRHHAHRDGHAARAAFMATATGWLRFLDRLKPSPTACCPSLALVAEFAAYLQSERGLSSLTIATRCGRVEEVLRRYCPDAEALRGVGIVEIDHAIAEKGTRDGCARASIRTYAYTLRAFFRYAEARGWCRPGLAAGIVPPRVYTQEQLPAAPTWDEVERLCAGTQGDAPAQIRDRALLLLFAVYGLRVGEVRRLRLDDMVASNASSRRPSRERRSIAPSTACTSASSKYSIGRVAARLNGTAKTR